MRSRFMPGTLNLVWSGDIIHLPSDEGWLYRAAVLDLHSRQMVGWTMQPHMQTALVKVMDCFRRKPAASLIFHSDRCSKYCSRDFQDTLKAWGIHNSMSRKGNCWDNAPTAILEISSEFRSP